MEKISTVIITLNEEKNIKDCILSVKRFSDEILVIDSFSTDKTINICKEAGCKIIQHKFEGHVQQKNFGVKKAKYNLVFCIDADERASEELVKSILSIKNKRKYNAYTVNRLNYYLTDWIKTGGWYPDKKIRLFDRRFAFWSGENPHDKVITKKGVKIGHLKGDILHLTYPDLSSHILQIEKFSAISAKEKFSKTKNYRIKLLFVPLFSFLKVFLFKGSFISGLRGYILAMMCAFSDFVKYAKLWELYSKRKKNCEDLNHKK